MKELIARIAIKAVALLAVYGTALLFARAAYVDYRDSNVSTIIVSKLADFDEAFEVNASTLRVRNPEFIKVCFTGDYVYALKDVQQWFATKETEFVTALRGAGGRADVFNGGGKSAIVLLSNTSAVILQLDLQTGFFAANLGCASTRTGDIEIRRYQTNLDTEFYLPNATLKSPPAPGQPQISFCAVKLQRFVDSIDELLAAGIVSKETFWAVVRKYLPARGCQADEVISIATTSKYILKHSKAYAYTMRFENADIIVSFELEKDTGNIDHPEVTSTGLPFS